MMEAELSRVLKLQGQENWNLWKFQTSVMAKAHSVWGVISGTKLPPVELELNASTEQIHVYNKALAEWQKFDGIAQKIIVTTVEEKPMLHLMQCETSKAMWDKLTEVYEKRSATSIYSLQHQWYTLVKDPSDDIVTHVSKLEELSHRLALMGEKITDSMFITKILLTLPVSLDHFISAWESTPEDQRTKVNLISRLTVEELRTGKRDEQENNAFASHAQSSRFKGYNQQQYKKKFRPGKCNKCKKPGHWARECRSNFSSNSTAVAANIVKGEALINQALTTVKEESDSINTWFLDSGASDHMTSKKDWFVTLTPLEQPTWIRIGDGKHIEAVGQGDINILAFNGDTWQQSHLSNVLYVPDLKYNLFSSGAALDKGLSMHSDNKICKLTKHSKTIVLGERRNKLFVMKLKVDPPIVPEHAGHAQAAVRDSLNAWHQKLVHQNYRRVKKILDEFHVEVKDKETPFCDACAKGKAHRLPFPSSTSKSNYIGELIHADLCGPMQVKSLNGSKYFLLFKDDFSHFRVLYFIAAKSDVPECIANFVNKYEKHCPRGIKVLRTDNGLEFVNEKVKTILDNHGIKHQRTVAYCPEQNGSAERENRTLVEAARTILYAVNFETRFWAEAVNTAAHVINCTGTSTQEGSTPYELWNNKKPTIDQLHIFGEEVYAHIPKQHRQKWDPLSQKGYFVGYPENIKGFRVWFPKKDKIQIVYHLIFTGRINSLNLDSTDQNISLLYLPNECTDNSIDVPHVREELEQAEQENEEHESQASEEEYLSSREDENLFPEVQESMSKKEEILQNEDTLQCQLPVNSLTVSSTPLEKVETKSRQLRDRNKLKAPSRYTDFLDVDDLFVAETLEPLDYSQAVNSSNKNMWDKAMKDEMESLHKNKVWELTTAPPGRTIIDSRWVYKLKKDANHNISRFKARLVAKGFNQKAGVDYKETFSPVIRYDTVRFLLTLATREHLFLRQFDVKTAFLNGDLEETIYMNQPPGFSDGTDRVCKLLKSIYGLKQSSRCWNKKFTNFLSSFNLVISNADPCLFISTRCHHRIFLAIYIDDGLIAAESQEDIQKILVKLENEFEITYSKPTMFLGLQIEQLENGSILLHQQAYAETLIERFRLTEAHAVSIPADNNQHLSSNQESQEIVKAPYREAIGALLYLSSRTRPDISFAVNKASRYMEHPTKEHWNAVKRILKYIKGTTNYGLLFSTNQDYNLKVYSDADYAGETDTRRSTSGCLVQLGSSIISWSSIRQPTVALSTTEAEYIAASFAVREIMWIRKLLLETAILDKVKITLYLDNKSALQLIENPVFHKRSKHIDVKYHYIRDKYQEKIFSLQYVTTKQQVADIFTKPLPKQLFQQHRDVLCMKNN